MMRPRTRPVASSTMSATSSRAAGASAFTRADPRREIKTSPCGINPRGSSAVERASISGESDTPELAPQPPVPVEVVGAQGFNGKRAGLFHGSTDREDRQAQPADLPYPPDPLGGSADWRGGRAARRPCISGCRVAFHRPGCLAMCRERRRQSLLATCRGVTCGANRSLRGASVAPARTRSARAESPGDLAVRVTIVRRATDPITLALCVGCEVFPASPTLRRRVVRHAQPTVLRAVVAELFAGLASGRVHERSSPYRGIPDVPLFG